MGRALKVVLFIAIISILAFVYYIYCTESGATTDSASKDGGGVILVGHANYFKDQTSQAIKEAAKSYEPKTIVLMSVDHYNTGVSDISIKGEDFITSSGVFPVDRRLITQLDNLDGAQISQAVFTNEHGINSLALPLSQNFARSSVLAFTIKDSASRETADSIVEFINSNCSDCLVVGSIDCSHYNPSSLSKIHDRFTLSALRELDLDKIYQAETDSPQVAYISTKVAKDRGMKDFDLYFNENTDQEEKTGAETTSVIIGAYSFDKTESTEGTTFVVAGDMMLDRLINHRFKDNLVDVLADIKNRVFWGADLRMLNFEGPISDGPIDDDISVDNLVFNFPPGSDKVLDYLNINVASLANNHSSNAGQSGLKTTRSILKDLGVKALGEQNQVNSESVARVDGPVPLSIVGINTLSNSAEEALPHIKDENSAGRFVIVFPHWGNEYNQTHNASQESMAKLWIDAGAGLIIGSHPHVVQDAQIIDGVPVIYSLGNFIFDQTFSDETQQGLIVAGEISHAGIKLVFLPTEQIGLRPNFVSGSEKSLRVDRMVLGLDGAKKLSPDSIFINKKEGDV